MTTVTLRPISAGAAQALLAGKPPAGIRVASDYPTEFTLGVAATAGSGSPLGPFFIHRTSDDLVMGEIGGSFVSPNVVEIGYALVSSCQGRGHGTAAVLALVDLARSNSTIETIRAHTPLDRPASSRVLAKAGFAFVGETDDEHEGARIRVQLWELTLVPQ